MVPKELPVQGDADKAKCCITEGLLLRAKWTLWSTTLVTARAVEGASSIGSSSYLDHDLYGYQRVEMRGGKWYFLAPP